MQDEIKKLIDGNKFFRKKYFEENPKLFNTLLEGQRPKILIISCSDSRIDPALIFNCKPGDLFVVRNVANLVPPCEANDTYHGISAALEFGVCFLDVQHIIILGHTNCGGIQNLLQNSENVFNKEKYSFIAKWLELARPAYERVITEHKNASFDEQIIFCERYSLVNSLKNLKTFPWIAQKLQYNTLQLHAWYFDLATGKINRYQQNGKWID